MKIKVLIQSLVLHCVLNSKTTSSQYVTGDTNDEIAGLTTNMFTQDVKSFKNTKIPINQNLAPNDKLLETKTWENGENDANTQPDIITIETKTDEDLYDGDLYDEQLQVNIPNVDRFLNRILSSIEHTQNDVPDEDRFRNRLLSSITSDETNTKPDMIKTETMSDEGLYDGDLYDGDLYDGELYDEQLQVNIPNVDRFLNRILSSIEHTQNDVPDEDRFRNRLLSSITSDEINTKPDMIKTETMSDEGLYDGNLYDGNLYDGDLYDEDLYGGELYDEQLQVNIPNVDRFLNKILSSIEPTQNGDVPDEDRFRNRLLSSIT